MGWTKRLEDYMHVSDENMYGYTKCGRPMLGNNYAKQFPDRPLCPECVKEAI